MEKQKKSLYCFKRTRILWKRCIRLYMGIAAYVRKHADALFGWTIAGLVVSIFLAWLMPKIGVFCGCGCGSLDLPPHIWAWALIVAGALVAFFGKSRVTVVVVALALLISGVEYLGAAQLFLDELGFPIRTLVIFLALYCSVYFIKSAWQSVQPEEIKREREEDKLSRSRLYSKIHGRIRTQGDDKGHAYALYGEWGSGKSHLLKYLERRLTQKYLKVKFDDVSPDEDELYQEAHHVCWVSLWHYHSQEEASAAIISALYRTIVGSRWYFNSKVLTSLVRYLPAFVSLGNAQLWDALRSLVAYSDSMEADDEISIVNNRLKKQGQRAVLFVEDAERAELEVIEHLLPLIERLNKIQGLTVICSIDFEELNRKCQKSNTIVGNVQGYLDKIFDMSFSMPDMPANVSKNFFVSYVKRNYPQCLLLKAFAEDALVPFSTPRQIQRVSARLASVEWMYLTSFQQENIKGSIKYKSLFAVEILKTLYIQEYRGLNKCPNIFEALNGIVEQNEERWKKQACSQKLKSAFLLYAHDRTFKACLKMLHQDDDVTISNCLSGTYARRNYLLDWEIEKMIRELDEKSSSSLSDAVRRFVGDLNPENYENSRSDVLSVSLNMIIQDGGKSAPYLKRFFKNVYSALPVRTRDHELINCSKISQYTSVNSFSCLLEMFLKSMYGPLHARYYSVFKLLLKKAHYYELVAISNIVHGSGRQNNSAYIAQLLGRAEAALKQRRMLQIEVACAVSFVDYLSATFSKGKTISKPIPIDLVDFYNASISQNNARYIKRLIRRNAQKYDAVELFCAALNYIRTTFFSPEHQRRVPPYGKFGFTCISLIIAPQEQSDKIRLCSALLEKKGKSIITQINTAITALREIQNGEVYRLYHSSQYEESIGLTIIALNDIAGLIKNMYNEGQR